MNRPEEASEPSLNSLASRLWVRTESKRRRQFGLLLLLMVFTSFAEALSISAVLPFLSALTQPSVIFDRPVGQAIAGALGLTRAEQIVLPLTIAFCIATILAGAARVLMLWSSTRVALGFGSDLSNTIYSKTLHQPYAKHIARNSSAVISVIWNKVSEVIAYVLLPSMTVISSIIIITVICAVLFAAVPKVALLAFGCLGSAYVVFVKLVRKRLARNSRHIANESTNMVKTLQEGLGGIRDVIIDGSQHTFEAEYRKINHELRKAQGQNQIMGQTPRYVVEALGMLMIAILAYWMSGESSNVATTIPTLAAMALGLQRLLPAAQQLYAGWSSMHGAKASLRDVLELLEEPSNDHLAQASTDKPLPFKRDIALSNVWFRYDESSPWILKGLNLTIPKGSRVGFIGPTGCGKSTLLDIVMGLLAPSTGELQVDGKRVGPLEARAWQNHIAHVPQAVFLADSTIAENIAFGVADGEIDQVRVEQVARQAQLADIIEGWPRGYATRVGERGVQLSGGQRQRIGIARALYKRADVIVFDEATSALDTETEQAVMRAIDGLGRDITILTIAHRINTLRGCTEIVELGGGAIVAKHLDTVGLT